MFFSSSSSHKRLHFATQERWAPPWRTWGRGLLSSSASRERSTSNNESSPLYSSLKKSPPPWIRLSDSVTKRLLNVPTQEPPPLSLQTSSLGDRPYPSCPLFLTPGGSAASAAPNPRRLPSRLLSGRLPSVTGPTLKSYQSFLQQQQSRHQWESFCLPGTMEAESSFVKDLTPQERDRKPIQSFILDGSVPETGQFTDGQTPQ